MDSMVLPGIYWVSQQAGRGQAQHQPEGLAQPHRQSQRPRNEPASRPRGIPAAQQSAQGQQSQRPRDEPASRPHGTPATLPTAQRQQQAAGGFRPEVDSGNNDGFLPPLSVKVKVRIVHDVAKVSCTQSFNNHSNSLIPQASYTFPLPAGCTIEKFRCLVGTTIIIGTVRPAAGATETFEEAVRRNALAGLLDHNTPEIFTSTLGNIPANTEVKAELSFIIQLKQRLLGEHTCTTLTLPVYLAPRYGYTPEQLQRRLGQSAQLRRLKVEVGILAATELVDIYSPSHHISKEIGPAASQRWEDFTDPNRRNATATLDDEVVYLDRDFVLDIISNQGVAPNQPVACMERHPEHPSHTALMITFPPTFWLTEQHDFSRSEIILVADRSGSMVRNQNSLKSALQLFVRSLPLSCRFNLYSFGSTHRSLWPNSQEYSGITQQQAEQYIEDEARVNLYGTELLRLLRVVGRSRNTDYTADIIILTDGKVSNTDAVIQFARDVTLESSGRVRFFCLGIGEAVSHELIEGVARAGRGYAEVIRNANEGSWGERIVAVLDAAMTVHVEPPSIEIHWDEAAVEANQIAAIFTAIEQSPANLSDISPFLQNRVYMLLDNVPRFWANAWLNIKTRRQGEAVINTRVPVNVRVRPDTTIHKFAARALLGDLETGQSRIHQGPEAVQRGSEEERRLARREGERLGCMWSLASKWTSFVAVQMTEEQVPLGFGDRNVPGTQEAEGSGLNLLRRRGVGLQAGRYPALPGPVEIESNNETSEGSDESSDSDFSVISRRNLSGNDSDSGSDDGPGMDNPGAGAARRQGSGGSGHGGRGAHQERRNQSSEGQGQRRPGPVEGQSQHTHQPAGRANVGNSSRGNNYSGQEQIHISRSSDPGKKFDQNDSDKKSSRHPSTNTFPTFDPTLFDSYYNKFEKGSEFDSTPKSTGYSMGKLVSNLGSFSPFGKVNMPSNNKPASTSLKNVSAFIPSSPENMAKQQLVTQILQFQIFDGSFSPQRAPVQKAIPGSLVELLGPGLRTLVEILTGILVKCIKLQLVEAVSWTIVIQSLLEIHFVAYRELWMLVYKKSSAFLYSTVNSNNNPELQKKLQEVDELAKSSIEKARFYAFPSSMDMSHKSLKWEKILSQLFIDHIWIPLRLPATKTDPLTTEEAQSLGRILPEDPLTDIIATQESSIFREHSRDSVVKSTYEPLKQHIKDYEETVGRLAEKRKKGGSKKKRTTVQFSPCDQWLTTS